MKPLYIDNYQLKDNEYLLKIDESDKMGFLTKLTQKGLIPKAFDEWRYDFIYLRKDKNKPKFPIYIHEEVPTNGWKLIKWRIGKSQEWATVMHPEGFMIEIYLTNFLEIVKNNTIINGVIQGQFIWKENKLV